MISYQLGIDSHQNGIDLYQIVWIYACSNLHILYERYSSQISLSKSNHNAKMDISLTLLSTTLSLSQVLSSNAVLSIHIFMLGWHWVRVCCVRCTAHSFHGSLALFMFQTSKNPKFRQSGIIQYNHAKEYLCSPSSQILLKSLKISFSLIIPGVVCFQ